jgi:hypothetical protein
MDTKPSKTMSETPTSCPHCGASVSTLPVELQAIVPFECGSTYNKGADKMERDPPEPDASEAVELAALREENNNRAKVLSQLLTLREAATEARDALENVTHLPIARGYPDGPCLDREDHKECKAAPAKLNAALK